MKKLTFQEIIERLKTLYGKVDGFAFEYCHFKIDDFPKAKEIGEKKDEFFKKHYTKGKWDSEENKEIYSSMPTTLDAAKELYSKQKNSLVWKEVDQYGGEGQGDTWYSVKYFPKHDIYIKVSGWYQSYNGTEFYDGWDSCEEVRPKKQTITVYE